MSAGPWFLRLAGRHLLPLLLFVFALLTISLRYQHHMGTIEADVVQQESSRLRERLSIDQSQLDQRMGLDDTLVLRRLVGALALHQGLERAYLIDPLGKVRASLSRLDVGMPVTGVLARAGVPLALTGLQTAPAPRAIVVTAQTDGLALSGDMPLQGGHRLLVWVDNTRAVAVRRAAVQDELAREAVLVLLAVAGLALLLHLLWFRRAQRLSRALGAMGAGDLNTRTGLQGRDELADIGAAADRMADQLCQEQDRLRHMNDLVNRSPAVVIEWRNQPGWPVVQVSESVRQWGYEPEQLLQGRLQYSDLLHPDDSQRIHDEVAHYFAHGPDEYRQTYRIRCADGRWAWVDDRTTLGRDAAGQVVNISGVLLDVSAQREAEQAQRQQAELLRMFYELPFLGMAISSPTDKRWLQVNDRLCEILGYPREALLRMTWAEMTPPGDLERNVTLFEELIAGQRNGYRMAKRFLRQDGQIVHTEIDVRAVRDETGRVQQLFATIQDVTERKAAEEALQRSQLLLLKSQQIGRMGSWMQDLASGTFSWSPQAHAIHETSEDGPPLTLEFILGLLHPDDVERVGRVYGECQQAGQPYDIHYRLRMTDGRIKHLHV
ncbi:MAG: PAS domain-containing protein, partial [Hydrogenophaga sp.]|uniref:HAMP domain-containing protein n=1 Tax=Hydrogenophaga sp. TaxID=1904254 RepID=UPI003D9B1911